MLDQPTHDEVIDALEKLLTTQFSNLPEEEIRQVLRGGAHDLAGQTVPEAFSEMLYLLAHYRLQQRLMPQAKPHTLASAG